MSTTDIDIENLKTRMFIIEGEIDDVKKEQGEQRKAMHEAAMESEKMSGKIEAIKSILEEMAKAKIRGVDIIIAIGVLLVGAMSAYAAIQNNSIATAMFELSKHTIK
jgi:hypothetical protein